MRSILDAGWLEQVLSQLSHDDGVLAWGRVMGVRTSIAIGPEPS
jgi:hypothetical protein